MSDTFDAVAWLREHEAAERLGGYIDVADRYRRAADELERLRAENAWLRAAVLVGVEADTW